MGRHIQIDIDCSDPESLAAFWAELMDYEVAQPRGFSSWREYAEIEAREPGEYWCAAFDPEGRGPRLLFHRVPERKAVKNRLHLDVWVAPPGGSREENWPLVDAEVERLVALGATVIRRVSEDDQCFVVMTDPEGNEFCACG